MGGFIRIFGSTFEVAFHPKTKKELESDARPDGNQSGQGKARNQSMPVRDLQSTGGYATTKRVTLGDKGKRGCEVPPTERTASVSSRSKDGFLVLTDTSTKKPVGKRRIDPQSERESSSGADQ